MKPTYILPSPRASIFVLQPLPQAPGCCLLPLEATCRAAGPTSGRLFQNLVSRISSYHEVFALTVSSAHNASIKCDRMRSQKLRRRPDSCHAFHPEVGAARGRGVGLRLPSRVLSSVAVPLHLDAEIQLNMHTPIHVPHILSGQPGAKGAATNTTQSPGFGLSASQHTASPFCPHCRCT